MITNKEVAEKRFKPWHFSHEAHAFEKKYGTNAICIWNNEIWESHVGENGRGIFYTRREKGL